jgi:hypothetical protein
MSSAKVLGSFLASVGAVAVLACGGEGSKLTGIIGDTTKTPVDTATANAAARTAATNTLLTQINDALTAMSQSASAGGAGGPTGGQAGGMMTGATATLDGSTPPADAAKCTFDDANVRWNCPNITQANIVTTSWFQFLDAANKPQKLIDTLSTASVRRFVGTTGFSQHQLPTPKGVTDVTDTVANSDTLTLSGLLGPKDQRKVISKGFVKHVMVPANQGIIRMSGPKTTEDFKFDPPSKDGAPPARRYPISGKITLVWTTSQDGVVNSAATTTQVTTYDGTPIAKLVITSAQGKVIRTCTYDMTSQTSAPTCTP